MYQWVYCIGSNCNVQYLFVIVFIHIYIYIYITHVVFTLVNLVVRHKCMYQGWTFNIPPMPQPRKVVWQPTSEFQRVGSSQEHVFQKQFHRPCWLLYQHASRRSPVWHWFCLWNKISSWAFKQNSKSAKM